MVLLFLGSPTKERNANQGWVCSVQIVIENQHEVFGVNRSLKASSEGTTACAETGGHPGEFLVLLSENNFLGILASPTGFEPVLPP
jgi:hypothetical protein